MHRFLLSNSIYLNRPPIMLKNERSDMFITKKIILLWFVFMLCVAQCNNNPYPKSEKESNIYYDTFGAEPKHLDPAIAYSSDEYVILQQIYEPSLQYHFLKRPYQLMPLTLKKMPQVNYYAENQKILSEDSPDSKIKRVVYTLELRSDIDYQRHPAFAKNEKGEYIYHIAAHKKKFISIKHPNDLPHKGSRKLTAMDYAYQIKRLANPQIPCPIYPVLAKYILGFEDLSKRFSEEIQKIREERKKKKGPFYDQQKDEKENPIYLDLRKYTFEGVKVLSPTVLQIILNRRYPQFIYWLAMPFFAPVPWEADAFYKHPNIAKQNITLDRFPIGTGPFVLSVNQPHYRMVLEKNTNYHDDFFPNTGEPSDKKRGFLEDQGKRLPLLDKAIYVLEKESIPRWNKFLQGYYDNSSLQADIFDTAIEFSIGGPTVTDLLKEKEIKLLTSVTPLTYYYAFNMLDDIVGGYTEKKRKLRQAISIALDIEEFIQIFLNGRGIPAQGPIPPGIFGYQEGFSGMNQVVYDWNAKEKLYQRKKIEIAKRLLAEAGYPDGLDKNGNPLVLFYDKIQQGTDKTEIQWFRKQFKKLGIDLQIRSTDYNQFRKKVRIGNFQIMRWGWHADYPDAENFMFLLYGPNGVVKSNGKNSANYNNPNYDRLFVQMETLPNSVKRARIIREMLSVLRKDSPWIWGFHPVGYSLYHSWYKNAKPMTISYGTLKYKNIDVKKRSEYRIRENQPITYPMWIIFIMLLTTMVWWFYKYKKQEKT